MTHNTTPTTEEMWRETQKHLDKLVDYLMSDDTAPIPDTAKRWASLIIGMSSPGELRDTRTHIGVTKLFLADLDKEIQRQGLDIFRRRALMVDQATAGEENQK